MKRYEIQAKADGGYLREDENGSLVKVEDALLEIRCLQVQVQDRGNSYKRVNEENQMLRKVLKEVPGCHEAHSTPKLCEGCLISIGKALETTTDPAMSKWVVHIIGPDDIIDQPDELAALREANALNKAFARMERTENDPYMIALAKDSEVEEC